MSYVLFGLISPCVDLSRNRQKNLPERTLKIEYGYTHTGRMGYGEPRCGCAMRCLFQNYIFEIRLRKYGDRILKARQGAGRTSGIKYRSEYRGVDTYL
ncbi:MAG: hypothetical protein HDR03_08455 [Lachnospiraceae bacterium]|nr:hypothetical protein [Lachnospiraceae bacterium]